MERIVGQTLIKVVRGDITQQAVDAIVNAANNHLWMGGGVAGAIKRAGGQEIEREAMARGPIPPGEAVATGAGRLPCRYVIHAVTMAQDLVTTADLIRRATRSGLRRADELKVTSVAFPALGTGVGGFPVRESAKTMLEEVTAYVAGPTGLRTVAFVAFDAAVEEALIAALRALDAP